MVKKVNIVVFFFFHSKKNTPKKKKVKRKGIYYKMSFNLLNYMYAIYVFNIRNGFNILRFTISTFMML